MTIQRMDHVGIVVDDLATAQAFFVALGLKLQGEATVEGGWVAVDDIDAAVASVRARGGELVGEVENYEGRLSALLHPRPAADHHRAGGADRLRAIEPRLQATRGGRMSDRSSLTIAQQGFDAWRRGDFETLEQLFALDVEWRWFEPGDWDCHSRKDVMRTLRQRHAAGFAEGRLIFHDAGPDVVVVTAYPREVGGPEWPDETSTVIRFRDGKVVSMQDYRTKKEALAVAR